MDSDRIKEIQEETAYPQSISVYKALLKVWNECQQEYNEQLRLNGVSGSFISKFQEIIYSDLSDSEIVNALHKLDNNC